MTVPNLITLTRLAMIPFFVIFAGLYAGTLSGDTPESNYRYIALTLFLVAALSDAVDGFIARNFNQGSALGKALDPVADKLLMLSAILTLSFTEWTPSLPIWFAILVVSRDILIVATVIVLHYRNRVVVLAPVRSSKYGTLFEFSCIAWVLLDFWSTERPLILNLLIAGATVFCLISAVQYFSEGRRQFVIFPGKPA